MNRTMLWMLAALCAASADAQPLSDAERAAILGMLSAEKPHYADVRTELNHTTDPLGSTPGYRLLGYMPSRRSCDVGKSILGIGYETLDRRTFDPKWTFPLVGGLGVKYARCQTGWMRCETERGKYDFGWLDEVVDGLAAEGVSTWLSLGFGNPLYTPCEKFEEQWKEAKAKGTVVPGWARGWVGESPRTTIAQAKALFRKPDGTPVRVWQGESGRATGKSRLYAFPSPYAQAKFIARRVLTDLSVFREGGNLLK